jgi:DNA polymerase
MTDNLHLFGDKRRASTLPAIHSLEEAAQCASQCTACPLSQHRKHVVFGEGNPKSPLVLVGEGPGEQEDLTGRPFVGPAGKLLDRALLDNGLSREDVYICNIVKCRAADWRDGRLYNRVPSAEEVSACSQWLDIQLRLLEPRVILCLGAPSASHIIHKNFQITKERGKVFPCRYGALALATVHPAFVLRQGGQNDEGYALLTADIGKAWVLACVGQNSK